MTMTGLSPLVLSSLLLAPLVSSLLLAP